MRIKRQVYLRTVIRIGRLYSVTTPNVRAQRNDRTSRVMIPDGLLVIVAAYRRILEKNRFPIVVYAPIFTPDIRIVSQKRTQMHRKMLEHIGL